MNPKAAELVSGAVTIKSLPEVYRRINDVINLPHSSVDDIAEVVSSDPGITVRLLGLVNSAFFGFPRKIETVTQAITVIGTAQLRELALATSVVRVFQDVPQELVDMTSFWRHALGCAVFARLLAISRREVNVERFFAAGLLHDIGGMVVLLHRAREAKRCLELCEETGETLHQIEQKILGFDHAEVGRALLESWNLPISHQEAVGSHHAPSEAFCFPVEASITHVADLTAHAIGLGGESRRPVPRLDEKAWETIGLSETIIPSIADEAAQQLAEVERYILWDGD
jgi:HD-like signal output (HDOD) protein